MLQAVLDEQDDAVPPLKPFHVRDASRLTSDSFASENQTTSASESGDPSFGKPPSSDLTRDSVSSPPSNEGEWGGTGVAGSNAQHYDPKSHVILRLECISETEMKVGLSWRPCL